MSDPALQDLSYEIAPKAWGKLAMAGASNRHGRLQAVLALELGRQLQGMVLTECSVLTRIGLRVPAVAWASPDFVHAFGEITPYTRAPEICVEILFASSAGHDIAETTHAYLAAGAEEVWLVSDDGAVRYVGPAGELPKSRFPVILSLPAPMKRAP